MKVLGLDPATMKSGIAIAIGGELTYIDVFDANKKDATGRRLYNWFLKCQDLVYTEKPDLVVVLQATFQRNIDTVRKLARTEGAAIIACKQLEIPVVESKDTAARSIVLNDGAAKKEDVLSYLRSRYTKLSWLPSNRGGQDQADAGAAALAGPTLLERR